MLLQNGKIIIRLNQNKNSFCLNKCLFDSPMTDLLPSSQKSSSYSDTAQFPITTKQSSMTDFTHDSEVNFGNIFGELTADQSVSNSYFRKIIYQKKN